MKTKEQLKQNLTIKYAIALSLIAILSTVAFYTLRKALKETNYTGYIVNISGKQRMLSQHIALDAHRIYANIKKSKYKNQDSSALAKQALKAHIEEFLQVNTYLSTGKLPHGDTIDLSPVIYSMYFQKTNLAQRVQEYSANAKKLLNNLSHEEIDEAINYIDTHSEKLLEDLNKVVNQYQKEGDSKLSYLKSLETIVFTLIIIILLLEVIFIFQPTVHKIVDLVKSKEDVLSHLEDIVELRTLKLEDATKKLKELAFHDPLTGLNNRLTLEQDIEMSIENFKKNNAPYAVLMLDIDWFKDVNDTYGHDVGDVVLKEFSNILVSSVREYDKVYRTGGEEFVILFNRIDSQDVIDISKKIKILVQQHTFKVKDKEFSKTVSSGLYHSSFIELIDIRLILKSIDTALYISKKNGRNRITNVNASMQCKDER